MSHGTTDVKIVSGNARKVEGMEAALSNSFGFGGMGVYVCVP